MRPFGLYGPGWLGCAGAPSELVLGVLRVQIDATKNASDTFQEEDQKMSATTFSGDIPGQPPMQLGIVRSDRPANMGAATQLDELLAVGCIKGCVAKTAAEAAECRWVRGESRAGV